MRKTEINRNRLREILCLLTPASTYMHQLGLDQGEAKSREFNEGFSHERQGRSYLSLPSAASQSVISKTLDLEIELGPVPQAEIFKCNFKFLQGKGIFLQFKLAIVLGHR